MFNIEKKQTNKKNTEELTIIAKTQHSELQFMSQSMVTNNTHQVPNSTPDTFDTSTPKVNNNQNIRYIPINQQYQQAKTFAITLHKMNFADTGSFINATKNEIENMTALSMYYTIGKYDPLNKFTQICWNRNIISIYKTITETKVTKTNALSRLYQYIHDISKCIDKNKVYNIKSNNKAKTMLYKTT